MWRLGSAMMGKERVVLEISLMSEVHLECEVRSLADCFHHEKNDQHINRLRGDFSKEKEMRMVQLLTRPINLTPLLSNSPFSLAKAPSSVVHTGVKSAG